MIKPFEVEMHAFCNGEIRRVSVPTRLLDEAEAARDAQPRAATLALVFFWGQNDFCLPVDHYQEMPSVSVGDIVRLPLWAAVWEKDDRYDRFVVLPVGFRRVTHNFEPPTGEGMRGGMYAYDFPAPED